MSISFIRPIKMLNTDGERLIFSISSTVSLFNGVKAGIGTECHRLIRSMS